jgi:hypothetical protein
MPSAREIYIEAIEEKLDLGEWYNATWPIGADVEIGMVVAVDGDLIVRGRLSDPDRGVAFTVDDSDQRPDSYQYASEGGVDVVAKAAGEDSGTFKWIGKASAGVKLTFTSENAVAIRATNVVRRGITNERQLARAIISAWHDGRRMDTGDVIITELLQTDSGFAAVSSARGAEIEVTAKADIGTGPISLGSLDGELHIAGQSKTQFAEDVPKGFAIAYRALEVDEVGLFRRHPAIFRRGILPERDYLALRDRSD